MLSRAEDRELNGELVDLADALQRATSRWRAAASARGAQLTVMASEDVGAAWCAQADLDRALDVLVENALGYSPAGGAVTLCAGPGRIEVHDRGPGLAAGEEEDVFERFHRGRAGSDGPPGSGLGLAIARTLARAWQGDVRISNRPGRRRRGCARVSEGAMKVTRKSLLIVLGAFAGIALAAAITLGTSQLVRQHIGLASEPLSAGSRLLPAAGGAAGSARDTAEPHIAPRAASAGSHSSAPRAAGGGSPAPASAAPATTQTATQTKDSAVSPATSEAGAASRASQQQPNASGEADKRSPGSSPASPAPAATDKGDEPAPTRRDD